MTEGADTSMEQGIFISYRRQDDAGHAGRIREVLVRRFGEERVFFDVASIPTGRPWSAAIDSALTKSRAFVLVIGPSWSRSFGARQSRGEIDVHLSEIEKALERGVAIFPLLVGAGQPLELASLPPTISSGLTPLQHRTVPDDLFPALLTQVWVT